MQWSGIHRQVQHIDKIVVSDSIAMHWMHKCTGPITTNELSKAQLLWIQSCQFSSFSANLKSNSTSNKHFPLVRQLWLFLDSCNRLRCGGRIHNAPVGCPQSSPTSFQPITNWQHWLCTPRMSATCKEEYTELSLLCDDVIGFWQHMRWLESC